MKRPIERQKAIWLSLFDSRYRGGCLTSTWGQLAEAYRWQGSAGISYSKPELTQGFSSIGMFKEFASAFSDVTIEFNLFGEGLLMANHFTITATHTGEYFNYSGTGQKVSFFGTAIAQFNKQGQIVHEWELWDEITLLKQLGVINSEESGNLISPTHRPIARPEVKFPECPLPPIGSLLHPEGQFSIEERDPVVARNINNWKRFLQIKYETRDFDVIDEVMSPHYRWQGSAGFGWDMSLPGARQKIFEGFVAQTEGIRDYQFHYRLFGQGNYMVYHIVCEYTHTAELINISPTGRKVRHSNISICHFDTDGRIVEEWETIDILAVYKQLGVIQNGSDITSFMHYINSI